MAGVVKAKRPLKPYRVRVGEGTTDFRYADTEGQAALIAKDRAAVIRENVAVYQRRPPGYTPKWWMVFTVNADGERQGW